MKYCIYTGCANNFVEVKYDPATSAITCVFLNQPQGMVIVKSCQIQYGDCQLKMTLTSNETTTTNDVALNLQFSASGQEYCYVVTASNGSHTVMVEGRISE